ncbi:MAG: Beta-glucosidase A [Firmicutes bacterium ADurb.Bin182]|nr:MAG: Beta-glucosidase A [Firmicutes bacterium ADurb.Bin182]
MQKPQPFSLPENLLLGAATAATQIEGGDKNNSWYEWCEKGHIKDGSTTLRANDHWSRYREDIELMADLGLQCYRLGVEWSRIEPEEGSFDESAIGHYREELKLLRENGIVPLITLHHFTNPLWFEKAGAFESKDCVKQFLRFVRFTVERLCDLCGEWITINEPNVYGTLGFVFGEWPPGKKSLSAAMRVFKNLALCHIQSYKLIHEIYGERGIEEPKVSFANHLRVFEPMRKRNVFDRMGASALSYMFQDALTKSMFTGALNFPVGLGSPLGRGRFCDFIAINYYTRDAVKGFENGTFPDVLKNDLGWEIYPEGLAELMREQYEQYKLPVWITENGTCDKKDAFRARFIYDHLKAAVGTGLPLERFYHWTFLDNFEWLDGESAPFGIVACDFETQKRTVKQSGEFYREIIKNRGVTEKMIDKYL